MTERNHSDKGKDLPTGDVTRPADQLGCDVAILLFDSGWLQRRKDAVELLNDGWVRRQTSIDCVIPRSLPPFGLSEAGHPLYLLPVALLPKVPPTLMRFDFDGEDGRLSLPLRQQNGLASYAALLYAASVVLNEGPRELPSQLREELLFAAVGPPEYAEPFARHLRAPRRGVPEIPDVHGLPSLAAAEDELDQWAAQLMSQAPATRPASNSSAISRSALQDLHVRLAHDPMTSWLLKSMAVASVVLAHVEEGRRRHKMVRLAYDAAIFKDDEPVGANLSSTLGWEGVNLVIETPYVGAHTYHFEFVGIEGIEVFDSRLLSAASDESNRGSYGPSAEGDEGFASRFTRQDTNRVHHYWTGATSVDQITAIVRLRVARENFVGLAYWASLAVALSILICGGLAQPLVRHGAGAATLLLLFPGLAATLVAGTSNHPLTSSVLQRAHRALLLSALCAYMTAGILVFIHTGGKANAAGWVRCAWLFLGVIALLPVGLLYGARKLPRPPQQEGRLEEGLALFQRQVLEVTRRVARQRQHRLKLVVFVPGLTWAQADALAPRSRSRRRFFVMPGPRRRRLRKQEPHLLLQVEPSRRWRWSGSKRPESQRPSLWMRALGRTPVLRRFVPASVRYPVWGRLPKRTPLRTFARPADEFLNQPLEMGRRLSATALWLGRMAPQGYTFEAQWPRRFERIRAFARSLWRWLVRVWLFVLGRPSRQHVESDKSTRLTPDELAVAIRGGLTRLNRRYEVGYPLADALPSDGGLPG